MRRRNIVLRLLVAAVGSVTLTCAAVAADLGRGPIVRTPVAPYVPMYGYSWTGFYSASSIGFGWVEIDGTLVTSPPDQRHNTSAKRLLSASAIGAQFQWADWVIGVEGSYNTLYRNNLTPTTSSESDCLIATLDRTCLSRVRNFWTAGGRLGYAWGTFLLYGTGGYASGKIETQTKITSTDGVIEDSEVRHNGWFGGVGTEYFITRLWFSDLILGLDYKHVEFDKVRHDDPAGVLTRDVKAHVDMIQFRIVSKY